MNRILPIHVYGALTLFSLLFVVYQLGGTYHFSYSSYTAFLSPIFNLRDAIENFLLTIPAGFFSFYFFRCLKNSVILSFCGSFVVIIFISFGMEFLQLWLPDRSSSVYDALLLSLGGVTGWGIGYFFGLFKLHEYFESIDLKVLLYLSWMAWAWIPLYLQLKSSLISSSIAPFTSFTGLNFYQFGVFFSFWIITACLTGEEYSFLSVLFLVHCAGLVLSPGRVLEPENIAGFCVALAVWMLIRNIKLTGIAVLIILCVFYAPFAMGHLPSYACERISYPPGKLFFIISFISKYWMFAAGPWALKQVGFGKRQLYYLSAYIFGLSILQYFINFGSSAMSNTALFGLFIFIVSGVVCNYRDKRC